MRSRSLAVVVALVLGSLLVTSCDDDDECDGGTCVCDDGEGCSFTCDAPPCTAICEGDNPHCDAECGNGECSCGRDSDCRFECHSPPCHVDCAADSSCSGTCANGDCECANGARCSFECMAGPCHVNCEGNNPTCDGTCANGTCRCGSGSTCRFACSDDNCHVECESGAGCLLDCPEGDGGAGCTFSLCAAGTPTVCPGGKLVACGRACPP
jgi:hypothetical protein